MRKFYNHIADKLNYFSWGRSLVGHIGRHRGFYENFEALYTALILALIIKAFLFEAYKIPSGSMKDTLLVDDRIFVNKFCYKFSDIDVGDVIVFKTKGIPQIDDPEKPYYIKRVVGLPGDKIRIGKDGFLYRNGEKLQNPKIFQDNRYVPYNYRKQEYTVPDGQVYVFGDNSRNSLDSRAWGGVPLENVMGRAVMRYWPPTRIGFIKGVPPELVRSEVAKERESGMFAPNKAQAAEQ
jgi:signal peptidase I